MSVLIKGMGFPAKENFMTQLYLICDKDGNWYAVDTTNKDLYKLIEVKEPHGRLIDTDKFKADYSMKNDCEECEKELQGSSRSCEYDRIYSKMDFCGWLDDADTVIEADDETNA